MKKVGYPQPDGTIPFEVKKSDTLVSIAAHCDISVGHLKKINRLMSENIFSGQVLYVPGPDYVPSNFIAPSSPTEKSPSGHNSSAPIIVKKTTKPRSPDGSLMQFELSISPIKSVPGHAERQPVSVADLVTLPRALSEDEIKKIDEECHQRFVKMDAKYIEPGDEEIPGVLLVTPDTFLFDADDSHPLVYQNGRDVYQFVTSILNITLVTIYHGTITSKFVRCPSNEADAIIQSDANDAASNQRALDQVISGDGIEETHLQHLEASLIDSAMDDFYCKELSSADDNTKISQLEAKNDKRIGLGDILDRRAVQKSADKVADVVLELKDIGGQKETTSLLVGAGPAPENTTQPTCDKLILSNDLKAEQVLLTENKDTVSKDTVAKDTVAKGTVLSGIADETRLSSEETKSSPHHSSNTPVCPEMGKCIPSADLKSPITVFLCVKIDRSIEAMKGFISESPPTSSVQGPVKSEYWYIIPCDKADLLYAFFAQWVTEDGSKGFFVTATDSTVDYKKYNTVDGQKLVCKIIKDWELWSSVEYRRMKSEEEIKRLPLPELSESSSIMGTSHIAVLICHLPAIAEGSPWRLVYSTSMHGFSLNTLYRKMNTVDSPVFLIVQDINDQVFGALISCPLKMSDHFYGSGESYLFTFYPEFKKFGWTGMNSFFVKGNKDGLAIGAGKGSNGLWLDGNLYHGRTQQCQTFENELLTISQDFTIKCLETWCFV